MLNSLKLLLKLKCQAPSSSLWSWNVMLPLKLKRQAPSEAKINLLTSLSKVTSNSSLWHQVVSLDFSLWCFLTGCLKIFLPWRNASNHHLSSMTASFKFFLPWWLLGLSFLYPKDCLQSISKSTYWFTKILFIFLLNVNLFIANRIPKLYNRLWWNVMHVRGKFLMVSTFKCRLSVANVNNTHI